MAVFDWMAPPQTYWTPPKLAEGKDRQLLALNGFKEDGTKNTFGKITSYLPFSGLVDNLAEDQARQAGLTDVADNIAIGAPATAAKSQVGLGLVVGAAGLLAGNPGIALKGGQAALGGIASSAAMGKPEYIQGRQSQEVGYYKDGGRPERPAPVTASDSTAVTRPVLAGRDRENINSTARKYPNQQANANEGATFVRNWVRGRAAAGLGGMTADEAVFAEKLGNPIVAATPEGYQKLRGASGTHGIFNSGEDRAYVMPSDQNYQPISVGAHETTHQLQLKMGEKSMNPTGKPNAAWDKTDKLIRKAVSENAPNSDYEGDYFNSPVEIHSRLMQLRLGAGIKPGERVTPALFKEKKDLIDLMEPGTMQELRQVLSEKQIIDLLDKTVDNQDYAPPAGVLNAVMGGAVHTPFSVRYQPGDNREDIVGFVKNPDGSLGNEVLQMRFEETIFDQDASDTIDDLTRSGKLMALGKFVAKERKTHPDWSDDSPAVLKAAGGGRPKDPAVEARQKQLKQRGFYSGAIDGISGPLTRAAEAAALKQGMSNYLVDAGGKYQNAFDPFAAYRPASYNGVMRDPLVADTTSTITRTPMEGDLLSTDLNGVIPLRQGLTTPLQPNPGAMAKPAVSGDGAALGGDLLGYGLDAARAITAAIGANQKLPTYREDPQILAERERLRSQRVGGIPAGERQRLENDLDRQVSARNENLRLTLGGGTSQAALLAAQAASAGVDTEALFGLENLNEQRKREAIGPYNQSLAGKQAVDYNAYQTDYANTVQSRDAFGRAVSANLQQISDRSSYNRLQPYTQKTLEALTLAQQQATGSYSKGINLSSLYANPALTSFIR